MDAIITDIHGNLEALTAVLDAIREKNASRIICLGDLVCYRIGWLCFPPPADLPNGIHADHATLLRAFGGIIERLNEPEDTWLLNHNDAASSFWWNGSRETANFRASW